MRGRPGAVSIFFSAATSKLPKLLGDSNNDEDTTTLAAQRPLSEIMADDSFVSLEKMKSEEAKRQPEDFLVIEKNKKKRSKPKPIPYLYDTEPKNIELTTLNVDDPELYLRQLSGISTKRVAELMYLNHDRIEALEGKLQLEPDNFVLYACHALLTNNIMGLDLEKLAESQNFLVANKFDRRIAETISVILHVRQAPSHEVFADLLRKRLHTDCYLNLAGMDFSNVDFSGANLSCAKLFGVNFSHAKLNRANLQMTNMVHVILDSTNCSEANFIGAKMAPFQQKGNIVQGATFIDPNKRLDVAALISILNAFFKLNIRPITMLANINRNIENPTNHYSVDEKILFLTTMVGHECFESDNHKDVPPEETWLVPFWERVSARMSCQQSILYQLRKISEEFEDKMQYGTPKGYHHNGM